MDKMQQVSLESELIMPFSSLAEAICIRVGCNDIYDWLVLLAQYYGLSPTILCPELSTSQNRVELAKDGLTLCLSHPQTRCTPVGDKDRWFLASAEFVFTKPNAWQKEAPFSLDIQSESLTSVQDKLGDDYTDITKDFRQSYYLDDGRVVEVTWNNKKGGGIKRILVIRLGVDIEFELPEE